MKKKSEYEDAKIEILLFDLFDIVTASSGDGGTLGGTDGSEGSGWTPRKNAGDW